MHLVLPKICPTWIPQFVWPCKNWLWSRICHLHMKFFTFLLFEVNFDPNFALFEWSNLKKIRYQSSLSCLKFDIVWIVRIEFYTKLNFCQQICITKLIHIQRWSVQIILIEANTHKGLTITIILPLILSQILKQVYISSTIKEHIPPHELKGSSCPIGYPLKNNIAYFLF